MPLNDDDIAAHMRGGYETKAKRLVRMCGIRMAALYLKNRGYTAEQAVILLLK